MDDGVELKQLTVGVDRVGLGVGAGLASAIVPMAISAVSVVIVLIICFWLFGCDCWTAAVAIQEKFALGFGGCFSSPSPETPGQSSSEIPRFSALSLLLAGAAGGQAQSPFSF
jgi:hypothetical protein